MKWKKSKRKIIKKETKIKNKSGLTKEEIEVLKKSKWGKVVRRSEG